MISLKHKLILTHPPKCAGTSIRTVFRDLDLLDLDEGHISLLGCREWLEQNHPEERFDDYRIVSFTRNPWDRVVSLYHHYKGAAVTMFYQRHHATADRPESIIFFSAMTFSEFCKSRHLDNAHVNGFWGIPDEGRFANELIRYESFADDAERFFLSLNIRDYSLPWVRHATNRPTTRNDYRTYYTPELREFIQKKFGYEIEHGGHTFDGGVIRK